MNTSLIKTGTILIAIDKCRMDGSTWISEDDKGTLTIGKEYTVEYVDDERTELKIIDDDNHGHYFTLDTLSNYFTVKEY